MKFQLSPITKGMIVSAAGGLILLHGSGYPLSSVNAQQKSAIQEELEKLYQQDGRLAPDMRVKSLPRQTMDGREFQESGTPGQPPVATQTGATTPNYDPSQLSTNHLQPAPRQKKKFLDRLMFWKKDKPVPRQMVQPTPPSQQAIPNPRPSATANRTTPAPTTLRESAVAPLAPTADQPYQRPVTRAPHPLPPGNALPPAPEIQQPRQPVTLELPMNDSSEERTGAEPLPKWNPNPQPQLLRQPVAQPRPVRKPIISAQPEPGHLPVIIPKVPPAIEGSPNSNRIVVSPGRAPESEENSALLPELDDANSLALPQPPEQAPVSAVEESPFSEPKALEGPRPMPEDAEPAPLLADQPQDLENSEPAAKLPNLDELPSDPLPIVPEDKQPVAEQPATDKKDFPDPFTDVSEQEADSTKTDMTIPDIQMNDTPAAELPTAEESEDPFQDSAAPEVPDTPAEEAPQDAGQPIPADENPFSGLKLDSADAAAPPLEIEPGAAPMLPLDTDDEGSAGTLEGPAVAPALPNIDPAFEDDFKLPVKKDTSEESMPEHPILEKIPDEPLPQLPAADKGDISWEEDQARREAKLALIAAREGETGMKGFCIVELRDNRDLVDAVPAFRSTYNLRTYHFSSLQAKIEFDKAPRKYVPAYDGNDPILLSTESEEREGSLDYALWFKGRLYLFTSQENLEVFQADPVLYSEN